MADADDRGLPNDAPPALGHEQPCVFCDIIGGQADVGVCRGVSDGFVTFPAKHQRPRNQGHMLLVPTSHYTTLEQLPAGHTTTWLAAVSILSAAVREAFHASGVTVRMNLGLPGQDVAHLHTHVIPRHLDDAFDTTRSKELSLAEWLAITDRLRPHLDARREISKHRRPPRGEP